MCQNVVQKKSKKTQFLIFIFSLLENTEIYHKKIWENVATFKSIRTPTDLMDLVFNTKVYFVKLSRDHSFA